MPVLSLLHLSAFVSNQSFYRSSAVASFPSRLSKLCLGVMPSPHFAAILLSEMLIEGERGVFLLTPRMNITHSRPASNVRKIDSEKHAGSEHNEPRVSRPGLISSSCCKGRGQPEEAADRRRGPRPLRSGAAAAMRSALQPCERRLAACTRVPAASDLCS